jgi:hypothetical protein
MHVPEKGKPVFGKGHAAHLKGMPPEEAALGLDLRVEADFRNEHAATIESRAHPGSIQSGCAS